MNKIKYFLSFTILLVFAAPAMASPLGANFANALDTGGLYGAPKYNTAALPDMNVGLTLADFPDIAAEFLSASYDAFNDALTVDGTALRYDDGSTVNNLFGGVFSLTATVDGAGNLSAGLFSIVDITGTLLTGDLFDIGFSTDANGTLEFLFDVTGGSLAGAFGGLGAMGGMIMTLIDFPGDWANDWVGEFGVVDVAALPAPEPGILLLGGLGLTLLAVARRRKS